MRILITGAAGFIGSHCVEHFIDNTDWSITGMDSLAHKGKLERVEHLLGPRFHLEKIDLAKEVPLLHAYFDVVINFAAESHVDRSIDEPVPFVRNNVELMINMLEFARAAKPKLFIQISTDEVYGPMHGNVGHPEWDSMLPSNPYSASKAAQEALAIAYWRTYGVPVIITNTMNNFGERQDVEKYVPMIIKKVLHGEVVPVHGTPDNIGSRYYLHARNHADALKFIIENLDPHMFPKYEQPQRLNIVGDVRMDNLTLAKKIAGLLDKELKYELVDFHTKRPGHDPHYGLDGSKIANLGWELPIKFDDSLKKMVEWTLDNKEWLQ